MTTNVSNRNQTAEMPGKQFGSPAFRRWYKNITTYVFNLVRYNVKIMFGGTFWYFLLAAGILFVALASIVFMMPNSGTGDGTAYGLMLLPGMLVIFYPSAFGIQQDANARMLEILFGIPDYRYKVWLVRLLIMFVAVFLLLIVLAGAYSLVIRDVPVFGLAFNLMCPVVFFGAAAFLASTITRSGNGTAVVMTILIIGFWLARGSVSDTPWNIFHNPYNIPRETSPASWAALSLKNRSYLLIGTVIAMLWGLLNLQKRENFI